MSGIISYEQLTQINLTLQKENDLLKQQNTELRNSIAELKKYYQSVDKFATTVYDPKKSTYKELEDKLKNFEIDKNREIDELWALRIKPLREKAEQLEKQLAQAEELRKKDIDELWETRITPLQNKVKDQHIQLESQYKRETRKAEEISHLEKVIENLGMLINYAVGYISACEQFRDKHPNDVKNWLFEGLK